NETAATEMTIPAKGTMNTFATTPTGARLWKCQSSNPADPIHEATEIASRAAVAPIPASTQRRGALRNFRGIKGSGRNGFEKRVRSQMANTAIKNTTRNDS